MLVQQGCLVCAFFLLLLLLQQGCLLCHLPTLLLKLLHDRAGDCWL
jgi:hypothetical protein